MFDCLRHTHTPCTINSPLTVFTSLFNSKELRQFKHSYLFSCRLQLAYAPSGLFKSLLDEDDDSGEETLNFIKASNTTQSKSCFKFCLNVPLSLRSSSWNSKSHVLHNMYSILLEHFYCMKLKTKHESTTDIMRVNFK